MGHRGQRSAPHLPVRLRSCPPTGETVSAVTSPPPFRGPDGEESTVQCGPPSRGAGSVLPSPATRTPHPTRLRVTVTETTSRPARVLSARVWVYCVFKLGCFSYFFFFFFPLFPQMKRNPNRTNSQNLQDGVLSSPLIPGF